MRSGTQVDLRIISEAQFGFALVYFTGSKEHNIKIRERSLQRGWSLSEYGFKGKCPPSFALKKAITEADVYKALSLEYIPPELRENCGEIDAAAAGKLPHLVVLEDVLGTFHNHTSASDGENTLREMIEAAEKRGWKYLGISDHSKSSFQANGLCEKRLFAQIEEIAKYNAAKKGSLYVFSGIECDILPDGRLDFADAVLRKLDYVIGSVHSALSQDEKTMTQRLIRAIENPYLTIVGHLTGRLLLQREGYAVNVQKVIDACIANRKMIEINGHPQRLDMDWRLWHKASEKGLLCCINTDAHSFHDYEYLVCGLNVARKGWLTKKDVFNTRSLEDVKNFLKR